MTERLENRPLVSVVMSFHNGGHALARALRSLLWQTYDNWELILLNDGSSDGADEIARAFHDPRIRVYGDSIRRGLPVRLNQGVALAKGEYVARMDADDIAFPERFMRQVGYLQSHPEVDLLATSALMVNEINHPIGLLVAGTSHEEICRRPWHGFPMPHPTWMGRAEWFRRNPYDERARKAQDQALLYRTYRTSQFAGLPEVLLGYRYAALSVRKTLSGRAHYLRAVLSGGRSRHLLAGAASHTAAAIRDLAAISARMDSRVIKARVRSSDAVLETEWKNLMQRLAQSDNLMGDS